VIDLKTMEVTATLDVGMRPRGLLLSSDNKLCTSAPATRIGSR
jgi:hypothetical protein